MSKLWFPKRPVGWVLSRAADPYAIRVGICLEVFTGLSLNFITIRI